MTRAQCPKESPVNTLCPLCHTPTTGSLRAHIQRQHGLEELHRAVVEDKQRGLSDEEIGQRYGISFGTLQRLMTSAFGVNVSKVRGPRAIKRWQPIGFQEETSTVWSFRQRGNWATHDGRYRGNWSPYIPRNVIIKYSSPGDVVLDYFVGGGTTAVEAKLLGRRCVARDINPYAVEMTRKSLEFFPPPQLFQEAGYAIHEPAVQVGDARDLSDIAEESIDLICTHPPYAGIIKYSSHIPGDLSGLSVPEFLVEMRKVARESMRVLKRGGKCAVLIGDARKSRHVVPIGFQTIRLFLEEGFTLNELVIKRQHNCKTTGFWYTRSIRHNFLLLAHEYLPVFEKPAPSQVREQRALWEEITGYEATTRATEKVKKEKLETTTVWLFPREGWDEEVRRNLLARCSDTLGVAFCEVRWGTTHTPAPGRDKVDLLYLRWPADRNLTKASFESFSTHVCSFAARDMVRKGGYFVVEVMDFRVNGELCPSALWMYESLGAYEHLALKEIVIVVPEGQQQTVTGPHLSIVHRYLLVYVRK